MPTASAASRPLQLLLRRVPPASQPPHATHAAAIPCAVPQAGTRTLASRVHDSCAAAAATSCRRCRPAATSAPRVTHAVAAPCIIPSRCRSVGEAVSPLPVTAAEQRPLCSCRTPLLQAPTTPHRSHAPLRHAKPVLSHCPPQATVEAPSRPPPSVVEATLPSSATSGHRCAPLSPQRHPSELTAAP
jgi:hypothetical protein